MADIRINSLSTTASASSSDDFIALDGTTNGTRKLNAYSPTFGGNLTVSGTGTFSNTLTASKGLEAGIDGTASQFSGNIAVNNGKGVFLYEPGTTTWLRFYSSTAGTLLLTDASATRQTWTSTGSTLAGNLTVSGNGLNTFGGTGATNASILFGANNVANASAGYLSISQRLNYGFALFGYNMTGTSGSDAYTSPKNATGSAGVELIGGSLGITRFIYSTAATTAGNALTVTEAARFSSGNLLLKSDGIDSGNGKLQLATHTTSAGGIGFGPSSSLYIAGPGDFRFVSSSIEGAITLLSGGTYVGSVTSGKSTYLVSGSGTTHLTISSSGDATFAGTIASSVARTAGATFLFANTDNTTGTSSSRLWATTGGGTGGDPILTLTVNGATDWTLGVDNSDSDKFKINNAFGLGTSDKLVLDGSGNMTIAGSLTTSAPTGGAGAWELGVYSATAPTATGYVTIEIGGVQYKLLAST